MRANATRVDAIEIDPVILALGERYDPEHPCRDARVKNIVNDARSFLRSTGDKYDLIGYGLLDSHALLRSASSVPYGSFYHSHQPAYPEERRSTQQGATGGVVVETGWSTMTKHRNE